MKYDVLVILEVGVRIKGVEAESQEEACRVAVNSENWHERFDGPNDQQWMESIKEFLVDEQGDEEYGNSRWWDGAEIDW